MDISAAWVLQVIVIPIVGLLSYWLARWLFSLQNSLADYKLYVAQNYATAETLAQMEARLTAHLTRIELRLTDRNTDGDDK